MATSPSTATHTDRLVDILRQGNAFKPETRDSLKTFLQQLFEERYHQNDCKRPANRIFRDPVRRG